MISEIYMKPMFYGANTFFYGLPTYIYRIIIWVRLCLMYMHTSYVPLYTIVCFIMYHLFLTPKYHTLYYIEELTP